MSAYTKERPYYNVCKEISGVSVEEAFELYQRASKFEKTTPNSVEDAARHVSVLRRSVRKSGMTRAEATARLCTQLYIGFAIRQDDVEWMPIKSDSAIVDDFVFRTDMHKFTFPPTPRTTGRQKKLDAKMTRLAIETFIMRRPSASNMDHAEDLLGAPADERLLRIAMCSSETFADASAWIMRLPIECRQSAGDELLQKSRHLLLQQSSNSFIASLRWLYDNHALSEATLKTCAKSLLRPSGTPYANTAQRLQLLRAFVECGFTYPDIQTSMDSRERARESFKKYLQGVRMVDAILTLPRDTTLRQKAVQSDEILRLSEHRWISSVAIRRIIEGTSSASTRRL